ncbi:uncharacterized protein LOC114333183 isoform X2 [Diabrotica virgifera virgifera]|uniref:Uncharacterized protein LOC114333183 isoform X2 n=1 Tax=Diabrotica virgifera virgifera TaxID=50390 RepID=A0A6P7FRE1_DIAVI|nr:uncharacterized protein LOC114333183 isoform X2 [Diabrotica virgifera virgifera]
MDKWLSSFKSKQKERERPNETNKQNSPASLDIEKPGCSNRVEDSPNYAAPTLSDNGDNNDKGDDPTIPTKKKIKSEKGSKTEKRKTFNSSWISVPQFMNWLEKSIKQPSSDGNEYAYCKVRCQLQCKQALMDCPTAHSTYSLSSSFLTYTHPAISVTLT